MSNGPRVGERAEGDSRSYPGLKLVAMIYAIFEAKGEMHRGDLLGCLARRVALWLVIWMVTVLSPTSRVRKPVVAHHAWPRDEHRLPITILLRHDVYI